MSQAIAARTKTARRKNRVAGLTPSSEAWRAVINASLIVSVLINLFILIVWMVLKLTNHYDGAISSALIGR